MTKTVTTEQLKALLQTARGALADIANSRTMTLDVARAKADRVYHETEPGPDGWPSAHDEPLQRELLRYRKALGTLTNGYVYPAEVVHIASTALSLSNEPVKP